MCARWAPGRSLLPSAGRTSCRGGASHAGGWGGHCAPSPILSPACVPCMGTVTTAPAPWSRREDVVLSRDPSFLKIAQVLGPRGGPGPPCRPARHTSVPLPAPCADTTPPQPGEPPGGSPRGACGELAEGRDSAAACRPALLLLVLFVKQRKYSPLCFQQLSERIRQCPLSWKMCDGNKRSSGSSWDVTYQALPGERQCSVVSSGGYVQTVETPVFLRHM